jgi:hypothetical protein
MFLRELADLIILVSRNAAPIRFTDLAFIVGHGSLLT